MKYRESTTEEQEQMSDAIERLQLKNVGLRAKLVALRDATVSLVENNCMECSNHKDMCGLPCTMAIKTWAAIDSAKEVKL